jgi:dTDP-glucose 4,6-dehydratase
MVKHQALQVIGFVDDEMAGSGQLIAGLPVLGTTAEAEGIVRDFHVDEVLVCVPPGQRGKSRASSDLSGVHTSIVPTVPEILSGEAPAVQRRNRVIHIRPHNRGVIEPTRTLSSIRDQVVLVTGGSGFIGSAFAERLADHNHVILFDVSFTGKPVQYSKLLDHRNVRCVTGDILDSAELPRLSREADIIVHTAAVLGVAKVSSAARETLETNYIGTSRLLQGLQDGRRLKRLIYFSTSEVFGVDSYRVDESSPPSVGPITESRWSYAIGKLAGEHLVEAYHRESNMPTVIVRPFNVFGPKRLGDYALLRFVLNALAGRPLEVHGDGSQIRSWCYIEDFCDALVAMVERQEAIGQDFNVGDDGNTLSIRDLAHKVVALAGSSSPVISIGHPFPDISVRVPALEKARKLLGYSPKYGLDQALSLTIDFYRSHWPDFSRHPALTSVQERTGTAAVSKVV